MQSAEALNSRLEKDVNKCRGCVQDMLRDAQKPRNPKTRKPRNQETQRNDDSKKLEPS